MFALLDTIIVVFAIYFAAWCIKESYLFSGLRRWLIKRSNFFLELFSCYLCTGAYAGMCVYFLHESNFEFKSMVLWAFAGGAISYIFDLIVMKLQVPRVIASGEVFEEIEIDVEDCKE